MNDSKMWLGELRYLGGDYRFLLWQYRDPLTNVLLTKNIFLIFLWSGWWAWRKCWPTLFTKNNRLQCFVRSLRTLWCGCWGFQGFIGCEYVVVYARGALCLAGFVFIGL